MIVFAKMWILFKNIFFLEAFCRLYGRFSKPFITAVFYVFLIMKIYLLVMRRRLKMWREEFNRKHAKVEALGFDESFIRKWNYYLSYCEAAFRMRNIAVAQVVLARPNNYLLV